MSSKVKNLDGDGLESKIDKRWEHQNRHVPFVFVVERHDISHWDASRGRTQSLVLCITVAGMTVWAGRTVCDGLYRRQSCSWYTNRIRFHRIQCLEWLLIPFERSHCSSKQMYIRFVLTTFGTHLFQKGFDCGRWTGTGKVLDQNIVRLSIGSTSATIPTSASF
jgi:hypothetical protein